MPNIESSAAVRVLGLRERVGCAQLVRALRTQGPRVAGTVRPWPEKAHRTDAAHADKTHRSTTFQAVTAARKT